MKQTATNSFFSGSVPRNRFSLLASVSVLAACLICGTMCCVSLQAQPDVTYGKTTLGNATQANTTTPFQEFGSAVAVGRFCFKSKYAKI